MPLTPNVGTGQPIATTWGNAIRDRTTQIFATKAELDTWTTAPDGAWAWVIADVRVYTRIAGVWCRNPDYGSFTATSDATGYVTGTHAVGKAPSVVLATSGTPAGAGAYSVTGTDNYQPTTFRVRTSLVSASNAGVRWVAWP